jgi:SnoaL-like domain
VDDLVARVSRLEDEAEIRRLILSYGPAADAGVVDRAAAVWFEDGEYDWDAGQRPFTNRAAIQAMLSDRGHRSLIATGVAHFAGPPLINVSDGHATALTYSLIMRRDAEHERFYLWRVSVAHWELERRAGSWGVRKRTNRLLDETGAGRMLLGEALEGFS